MAPPEQRRAEADTWPPGWGLVLDRSTRRPRPDVIVGGSPLRVIRLTARGGAVLDRLLDGPPDGPPRAGHPSPGAAGAGGALARRLTDAGLANPSFNEAPGPGSGRVVSVVIPVRDRANGLSATLAALGGLEAPGGPRIGEIIVVDDASVDRAATRDAVTKAGVTGAPVRLVQRDHRGGPGAARNTGWREADSELVVFVDADCTPEEGWLVRLIDHFGDPALGSVAPRIRTPPPTPAMLPREHSPAPGLYRRQRRGRGRGRGRSSLGRYEAVRSPLDLGPDPGQVRPAGRISYVPSATIAVRRSVLEAVGGFDERMPVGEDVDLVWRLVKGGWRVRYEPAATVRHPRRATLPAWLRQRYDYGTSSGPLALRHGQDVAPLRMAWPSAAVWAVFAMAGVGPGVAAGGLTVGLTARRLPARTGLSPLGAAGVAATGSLRAGRAIAEALRRPWWPVTLVAACAAAPRARRRLLALVCLPLVFDWWRAGRPTGLAAWIALRIADDVAHGTGVVVGAWRARTPGAILPRLAR